MSSLTNITSTRAAFPGFRTPTGATTASAAAQDTAASGEDRAEVSVPGQQPARGRTATPAQPGSPTASSSPPAPGQPQALDDAAQRTIQALKQRDKAVRLHEQAHLLTAGAFARGGPRYTYETGPDGQLYAIGGEVPIDLSSIPGDPAATIQKALTIRRAALAPADPSGPDLAVAAKASNLAAQAQQELTTLQTARLQPTAAQATGSPTDRQGAVTSGAARHVCGPNCHEHDVQRSLGALQGNTGRIAPPNLLASKALEYYQLASRTP